MGREWRSGWLLAVLLALAGAQQQAEDVQDVIIIGAGLAGLSAANRILDQSPSTKLLVLEAKEASGGRLLAHQMKTAQGQQAVDIGSQWIGPKHTALLALVQKFGLTAEVQPICGERIILSKNTAGTNFLSRRRKRSYQWSSLGTSPSISDVFSSSDLAEFGGESAAGFIKSGNLDSVDGDGIRRLLQVFYDAPDTTVSALQLLLTASSENSTIDDVLSEMGHGTGLRVKEGLGQLVSKLATRDGLTITYSSPVTTISQEDDGTQTITAGGKKYSAKQVIIAVPPAIAAGIDVNPALPQNLAAFLGSYKPRGFATYFALTYSTPFWRENGNSGQIIYAGTGGDLLWLTTFDTSDNNGCAFEGTPGVLWGIAHFGSDSLNADQRYAAYVKVMAEAFPNSGDPLDHFDYQFYDDEYALGSVGTLPVQQNTDDVAAFFEAFNADGPQLNQSLHFASAEYSSTSMGMMNGAVVQGQHVADVVLKQLGAGDEQQAGGVAAGVDAAESTAAPESTTSQPHYDFQYSTSPQYPDILTTESASSSSTAEPGSTTTFDYTAEFLGKMHDAFNKPNDTTDEPTASSSTVIYPDLLMQNESTTPFVYETSSQYEATTPDTTVAPPEQKQYDFPYSTSTQYAPEDLGYGEASTTESPENSTLPDRFVPDLAPPPSNLTSNGTDTDYPDDLISAVGLNATQPSNETESTSPTENPLVDDVINLLNGEGNATQPHAPGNETTVEDAVLDILNPDGLDNSTSPANETALPDEVLNLLNPDNSTLPSNETSIPDEVFNLLNPETVDNSTVPANETALPDEVLNLLNPDNSTSLSNETALPDAVLNLLNAEPLDNSTSSANETALPDQVLNLLNPDGLDNSTSPGNETALPDDVLNLLNPETPLNGTEPSNNGTDVELNPTASPDTTNSTTPENTTDFDVSNVTSPNNATELDDSAFNATTPLTNSTDSGEEPEFARLTVLRDVQSVPQQDDMENNTSPTTEAFVYQTSSQYPPGAFDDNEPEASSQSRASSTSYAFLYQTSSQYPPHTAAFREATSVQPDLNTLLLADEPLVQLLNATTPEAPAATSNATESAEDLIQEAVQTVEQNIKKVSV
ncbi:unnamed protein product, partial [Mesorhabditis spiculigera]